MVLKDFDSAFARGFFQFVGESDAGAKRQIACKFLARSDGKRVEALEPDLFDNNGIFENDFGRGMRQAAAQQKKRAGPEQDPPHYLFVFAIRLRSTSFS